MITTLTTIKAHSSDVTPEQIGRCTKAFSGSTAFYQVLSERDNLTEYTVTWSREHGFQCSCPAGAEGFAHVHHSSGVCKHVRWAVAAAEEERAALSNLPQREQRGLHSAILQSAQQRQRGLIQNAFSSLVAPTKKEGLAVWLLLALWFDHQYLTSITVG